MCQCAARRTGLVTGLGGRESWMSTYRVRLFGRFELTHGEAAVGGLEARKVQELLCYLLIYREQAIPAKW